MMSCGEGLIDEGDTFEGGQIGSELEGKVGMR